MTRLLTAWYQQRKAFLAYRRGLAHSRKMDHPQAIAAFTQALAAGFAHPAKLYLHRGLSHVQMKQIEDAIADFNRTLEHPNRPPARPSDSPAPQPPQDFTLAQAHYQRGLLRQQSGNEAGALADWSAAIAHWPQYSQPLLRRALVYLSQGHHELALADLDAALTGNPTLAPAYLQRGNLRYQLGDIPGAVADWELAVCNDLTLEEAKQKLAGVHQANYDAQLTEKLKASLAGNNLTVKIHHSGPQLDIHIHRPVGTGINYYTLPDRIREQLVPLHLAEVKQFHLIGYVEGVNRPDWSQTYDLYKGQPCPPSNWESALSALILFPPLGIPAFIQAAQVKKLYQQGHYIEALRASKAVKGLCIAGGMTLGLFALLPLGYAAYQSMKEPTKVSLLEAPLSLGNPPLPGAPDNSSNSQL